MKKAERDGKLDIARVGFDEALKAREEIDGLTDEWVKAAKRGEFWALQGI